MSDERGEQTGKEIKAAFDSAHGAVKTSWVNQRWEQLQAGKSLGQGNLEAKAEELHKAGKLTSKADLDSLYDAYGAHLRAKDAEAVRSSLAAAQAVLADQSLTANAKQGPKQLPATNWPQLLQAGVEDKQKAPEAPAPVNPSLPAANDAHANAPKALPETLPEAISNIITKPERRFTREQFDAIPEQDRAALMQQYGMLPPLDEPPPVASVPEKAAIPEGEPTKEPRAKRQPKQPHKMPGDPAEEFERRATPEQARLARRPPPPLPETMGETVRESDPAEAFERRATRDQVRLARKPPPLPETMGQALEGEKERPRPRKKDDPTYLQQLYGQRRELPSLGHALIGAASGRQTYAERREEEKKGGTYDKSFAKDLTRVLLPEWAETLGFNNKYADEDSEDQSKPTEAAGSRRPKVSGRPGLPSGGGAGIASGSAGNRSGAAESGPDKSFSELTAVIKELTTAVKELTVAVKEKSRQEGKKGGGSQTQATPAGAKGILDQLKRAVSNSGNQMLSKVNGSNLARSGPAMEGGAAEGAGAIAAEAAPAAAGGAAEVAALAAAS